MIRHIPTTLALGFILVGCAPPETEESQPPAEELQSSLADRTGGMDEERLLGAPGPVVEGAVEEAALDVEEGEATFYADMFEGRRTASGRTFRQAEMVAAHRAFPFGTRLRVTNVRNDREVEVEVVDRGPFGHEGQLAASLDLSRTAAEHLGFVDAGRAKVQIEVLEWGP